MSVPKVKILNDRLRVGFVGAGNMATAICEGLINSGYVRPEQIYSSAPSNNNIRRFKELGCHTTNDNSLLFQSCEFGENNSKTGELTFMIFICVKPFIPLKLPGFWDFLAKKHFIDSISSSPLIIISPLAGVQMSALKMSIDSHFKDNFPYSIRLARIMPNTAVSVNEGCIGLTLHSSAQPASEEIVSLLNQLGYCALVTEEQLDAVAGVAGSGIAYVYTMIQAMADGGVLMGLPRQAAVKFAAQTAAGAAQMVLRNNVDGPIALRDKVCSPGGTTISGIYELEKGKFNAAVMSAVQASTKKCQEFSNLSARK